MAPQSTSSKKSTVINAILSILVSIIVVSSLARYITGKNKIALNKKKSLNIYIH
jgi:hypothetical protein